MIIDIIGAGSLGLLFYSKMMTTAQGHELRLWTRTEKQAALIRTEGIVFHPSPDSAGMILFPHEYNGCSVHSVELLTEHPNLPAADIVLIMVKQKHIDESLISLLSSLIQTQTLVVGFQNGIRTDSVWKSSWQVYAAITTEGAKKAAVNEVVHSGNGETLLGKMSKLNGSSVSPAGDDQTTNYESSTISFFINWLTRAGLSASLSNNIEIAVYRKLTINAVINPLTALWRVPNGELLQSEMRMQVMRQLYDEAVFIYEKNNIAWSESWWDDILQVCNATAANTSSMLADVLNNQPTEVRWINGAIAELARRQHLRADKHEWLCCLIESLTLEEAD